MDLDNILVDFDFDKNSEHYDKINTLPKKSEIEAVLYIFNRSDFYPSMVDPSFQDIVSSLGMALDTPELENPMIDSYFYALGVKLFRLSIQRKIDSKNIHTSKQLFEWSIAINSKYYQAYNKLGDCHMAVEENYKTAISCFKYSNKFIGSGGTNDLSMFVGSGTDTLKGDNYLKIGLSLLYLDRKEEAKVLITKAREYIGDDYLQNEFIMSYSSWDEIMKLFEDYNSKKIEEEKKDEEQNKEIILDKIQEAVNLKRSGDFQAANSLYIDLNNKYPNNPKIIVSWAKILVCMQEYDKAIEKFANASILFKNTGNSYYYQSNEFIQNIQNRFDEPGDFKNWVSAVSGGSIEPNDVNL